MLMLKGQHETPLTMATVIFVILIVTVFTYIAYESREIAVFLESTQEALDEIDITHLARACLGNNGILDKGRLDLNRGKNIMEICVINNDRVSIKVHDLETGEEWSFGPEKRIGNLNRIFVNIKSGEETHIGDIYADV